MCANVSNDVISSDGTMSLSCGDDSYRIEVRSQVNNRIIKKRVDQTGYHMPGGFSLKGDRALYLTFDRHWYLCPIVTVWNFKRGDTWSVQSEHSPQHQYMQVAFNADLSEVILGGVDGSVSLVRPYDQNIVWHREQAFGNKSKITELFLPDGDDVVWVSHEKGVDALSLSDGSPAYN